MKANVDFFDDSKSQKSTSSANEFMKRLANLSKANSKECTQGTDSSQKDPQLHYQTERNITTFNLTNQNNSKTHLNLEQ